MKAHKDGKMACCSGDKCPMMKDGKAGCCGDKCPMMKGGKSAKLSGGKEWMLRDCQDGVLLRQRCSLLQGRLHALLQRREQGSVNT